MSGRGGATGKQQQQQQQNATNAGGNKQQQHHHHQPRAITAGTIAPAHRIASFPSAPDNIGTSHNAVVSPAATAVGIAVSPSSFFPATSCAALLQLPRSLKVLSDVARGSGAAGSSPTTPTTATPSRTRNAVLGAFWSEIIHLTTQFGGGIVASGNASALSSSSAAAGGGLHGNISGSSRTVTPARERVVTPGGGVGVMRSSASTGSLDGLGSPRGGLLSAAPTTTVASSSSLSSISSTKKQKPGASAAEASKNSVDSTTSSSSSAHQQQQQQLSTPTTAFPTPRNSEQATVMNMTMRNKFNDAFKQLCDSASIVVQDLSNASVQRARLHQQLNASPASVATTGASANAASQKKSNNNTNNNSGGSNLPHSNSNSGGAIDSPTVLAAGSLVEHDDRISLHEFLSDISEYVGACCGVPKELLQKQCGATSLSQHHASASQSTERNSSVATTHAFQTGGHSNKGHHHHNNNNNNNRSSAASVITTSGVSTIAGGETASIVTTTAGTNNRAILANPRDRRRQREEVSAAANLVLTRGHQAAASASRHSGSGLDNSIFEALGGPIQQHGIEIPLEKQNIFMPWTLAEPYPKSVILERVPIGRFNASKFGQQMNLGQQTPSPPMMNPPGSSSNNNNNNNRQTSNDGTVSLVVAAANNNSTTTITANSGSNNNNNNNNSAAAAAGATAGLGYSTILDICRHAATPDAYSKWVARNRALRVPTADGGDAALTFLRAANMTSSSSSATGNNSIKSPPGASSSGPQRNSSGGAGNNSNNGKSVTIQQPPRLTFPHSGDASILGINTSAAAMGLSSASAVVASSVQVPREWLANFVHYGVWATSENKDAHGSRTPAWKPAFPANGANNNKSPRMEGAAAAAAAAAATQMTPLTL